MRLVSCAGGKGDPELPITVTASRTEIPQGHWSGILGLVKTSHLFGLDQNQQILRYFQGTWPKHYSLAPWVNLRGNAKLHYDAQGSMALQGESSSSAAVLLLHDISSFPSSCARGFKEGAPDWGQPQRNKNQSQGRTLRIVNVVLTSDLEHGSYPADR